MHVHEFNGDNEVDTEMGRGIIWYMTDYGWNGSTTYTIILNNGKIVTLPQNKITHTRNFTFGRGKMEDLKKFVE